MRVRGVSSGRRQDAPARDDGRAAWLRSLRRAALVVLGVRLGLWLVGLLSAGLLPSSTPVDVPGWPAPPTGDWRVVVTAWERHDALWYLRIAADGYRTDDGSAAFFPLYPLLVRAVATVLGGAELLGALVVTTLALVAGLTVLHRLTALELDEQRAGRTVLYVALFPTGLFLFAPYSEALFLALSVGCLHAARQRAWLLAALLGALAAATRSSGVLLVLPLAVEAGLQLRESSGPLRPRLRRAAAAGLATAVVPLGTAAYLAWWARVDTWRRPLDVQGSTWDREPAWPWETLLAGARVGTGFLGDYPGGYHTLDLVVVTLALAAAGWVTLRCRATYAVWCWASLLPPLTLPFDGRPFLSLPRFVVVVFPLFWALTAFADRWRAHDAVVAASACGLGLLSVLYVNWYFVL